MVCNKGQIKHESTSDIKDCDGIDEFFSSSSLAKPKEASLQGIVTVTRRKEERALLEHSIMCFLFFKQRPRVERGPAETDRQTLNPTSITLEWNSNRVQRWRWWIRWGRFCVVLGLSLLLSKGVSLSAIRPEMSSIYDNVCRVVAHNILSFIVVVVVAVEGLWWGFSSKWMDGWMDEQRA